MTTENIEKKSIFKFQMINRLVRKIKTKYAFFYVDFISKIFNKLISNDSFQKLGSSWFHKWPKICCIKTI